MSLAALRDRPLRWWLREIGLTVAAVLGVVCLLSAIASLAFGVTPLVFRSGSMAPAVDTGSLAIARKIPADTVRPGQIVSVTNSAGTRITHRVVEAGPGPGGTTELILRGDANSVPDAEKYVVVEVDLVLFAVPGLGYAVAALTHPVAIFLGGGIVGALLMYAFGRRRADRAAEPKPEVEAEPSEDSSVPRRAVGGGLVLVVAAGLMIAPTAQPTAAAFTDTGTAVTGTFRGHTIPAPTLTNCSSIGLTRLELTWNAVTVAGTPAPTEVTYDITLTPDIGSPQTFNRSASPAQVPVGLLGSGRVTVQTRAAYPAKVWLSAPSNSIRYTVLTTLLSC